MGCRSPHVFVTSTSKLNAALIKSGTHLCATPRSSKQGLSARIKLIILNILMQKIFVFFNDLFFC